MSVNTCCCTPPPNSPPLGSCCYVEAIVGGQPTPRCEENVDEIYCSTKTESTFNVDTQCGERVLCEFPNSSNQSLQSIIFNSPTNDRLISSYSMTLSTPYPYWGASRPYFIGSLEKQGKKPVISFRKKQTSTGFGKLSVEFYLPSNYQQVLPIRRFDGLLPINQDLIILDQDGKILLWNQQTNTIVPPDDPIFSKDSLILNANTSYLGRFISFSLNSAKNGRGPFGYHSTAIDTLGRYKSINTDFEKQTFLFADSDIRAGKIYQTGSYMHGAAVKADENKTYLAAIQGQRYNFSTIDSDIYVQAGNVSFPFRPPIFSSEEFETFIGAYIEKYTQYDHITASARYDKVSSINGVVDVQTSQLTTCALTSDGNVFSWGNPMFGGDPLSPNLSERTLIQSDIANRNISSQREPLKKNYYEISYSYFCLGDSLETSGDCIKIQRFGSAFLVWRQNNKLSIIFGNSFRQHDVPTEPSDPYSAVRSYNSGLEAVNVVRSRLRSWQSGAVEFEPDATIEMPDGSCIIKEKQNLTQDGRKYYILKSEIEKPSRFKYSNLIVGEVTAPVGATIKKILPFTTSYRDRAGNAHYSSSYLILWSNNQLDFKTFSALNFQFNSNINLNARTINNADSLNRLDRACGLFSSSEGVYDSRSFYNIQDVFVVDDGKAWGFIGNSEYEDQVYNCHIFLNDGRTWPDSATPDSDPLILAELARSCLNTQATRVEADYYYYYRIKIANIVKVDQITEDTQNKTEDIAQRPDFYSYAVGCILMSSDVCYPEQTNGEFSLFYMDAIFIGKLSYPGNLIKSSSVGVSPRISDATLSLPSVMYSSKDKLYYLDGRVTTLIETDESFNSSATIYTTKNCLDLCNICFLPYRRCNSETGECTDCYDINNNFICDLDNTYPLSHTVGTCAINACPPPDTPGCCCKTFFTGTPNSISVQDPVLDESDCAAKGATIYTPQGDPISDSEVSFSFKPFDNTFTISDCLNAAVTPFCSNPDNPTPSDGLSYRITNVEYSEYNGPNVNGTRFTFTIQKLNPNVTGRINIRGCSYSKLTGENVNNIGTSSVPPDDSWTTYSFDVVDSSISYSQISNLDFTWVAGKDVAELDQQLPSCSTSINEPQP